MTNFTSAAAIVLILCTTACTSTDGKRVGDPHAFNAPPMEQGRRISEQDCRNAFNFDGGNLRCL